MSYTSVPANGYEQADIHSNHIISLIYLLKKHFDGPVTMEQADLLKMIKPDDCLQIRVVSPTAWTVSVGKSLGHERVGVSYLVYKEVEELNAETVSKA